MSAFARSHGAQTDLSGDIAIYATWLEDIYFYEADGTAKDISGTDFEFQFRCDPSQTDADITLSTTAGTLSVVADSGAIDSILRLDVPAGTFASYPQDMIADLVGQDSNDDVFLYAHGVVSFRNNPVTF